MGQTNKKNETKKPEKNQGQLRLRMRKRRLLK